MQPLVAVTRFSPQSTTVALAGRSVLKRRERFCPFPLRPDKNEKLRRYVASSDGAMSAAEDLYGAYSPEWNSTSAAWVAAGVSNPIDDQLFFAHQQYLDFLGYTDPNGEAYWAGTITVCGSDTACIDRKRVDVALAFLYYSQDYNTNPAFSTPNTPTYNDAFVELCYEYQGSTNQGFLQRLPDSGGKAFWVNILNSQIPNSDYRGVTKAFITSYEYRLRFVPTNRRPGGAQ